MMHMHPASVFSRCEIPQASRGTCLLSLCCTPSPLTLRASPACNSLLQSRVVPCVMYELTMPKARAQAHKFLIH